MQELWSELSRTLRLLRTQADVSLRVAENESGVGRGTLSQIETGKARPNRRVVEWYESRFGADGMLLSMYAEARVARGTAYEARSGVAAVADGDALRVVDNSVAFGEVVECGATLRVAWTLRNDGDVAWRGRHLERIGPRLGIRLIASEASASVPDCEPGDEVLCRADVRVPSPEATYAAHWQMTDSQRRVVLPFVPELSILVTARNP